MSEIELGAYIEYAERILEKIKILEQGYKKDHIGESTLVSRGIANSKECLQDAIYHMVIESERS